MNEQMGETPIRFICHWIASAFGYFLHALLPLFVSYTAGIEDGYFPRWWSILLMAGLTSLVAATLNSNLPVTPRELMKSIAIGFTLKAVTAVILS